MSDYTPFYFSVTGGLVSSALIATMLIIMDRLKNQNIHRDELISIKNYIIHTKNEVGLLIYRVASYDKSSIVYDRQINVKLDDDSIITIFEHAIVPLELLVSHSSILKSSEKTDILKQITITRCRLNGDVEYNTPFLIINFYFALSRINWIGSDTMLNPEEFLNY